MSNNIDPLRERLLELRQHLLDEMRRIGPEVSYLQMMSGIVATLNVLDQVDAGPIVVGGRSKDKTGIPPAPSLASVRTGSKLDEGV